MVFFNEIIREHLNWKKNGSVSISVCSLKETRRWLKIIIKLDNWRSVLASKCFRGKFNFKEKLSVWMALPIIFCHLESELISPAFNAGTWVIFTYLFSAVLVTRDRCETKEITVSDMLISSEKCKINYQEKNNSILKEFLNIVNLPTSDWMN